MRTTLRKIGNSRGVIIPAALLNECGLSETVELRLEGARLIIESVKTPRADWFQGYDAARDADVWGDLPLDADAVDWEWLRDGQSFCRGDIYWVNLDPTIGTEINKTGPGLIVSPDDMNVMLPRVIIAPITSKGQPSGCRPVVPFKGKEASILLDQLRAVDKRRLTQKMGFIEPALWLEVLLEMLG